MTGPTLRWICVLCGAPQSQVPCRGYVRCVRPRCRERYRVSVEFDGYDIDENMVSTRRLATVLRLDTSGYRP